MSRHELKLTSSTVVRYPDGPLGNRLPNLEATDPTGDVVRRPTCYTADKNTVAHATTALMADLILPAGAAIAAFVMAVISWYGRLCTSVQDITRDSKS